MNRALLEQAAKAEPKVDWSKVDDGISKLVEKKLARQLKPARWPFALAGVCALAAVAFLVVSQPKPVEPVSLEVAAAEVLPDGSELTRGPESELRVVTAQADEVRLALSKGRVDVKASHRARRLFVVESGDVKVFVVGTVFSVDRLGAQTVVQVTEGKVRVEQGKAVRYVSAGESLQLGPAPVAAVAHKPHRHPKVSAAMEETPPIPQEPAVQPIPEPEEQSVGVVEVSAPPVIEAPTPAPFVPPDMELRFIEAAERALNQGNCQRFLPGLDELRLDREAPERASRAQQLFDLCRRPR